MKNIGIVTFHLAENYGALLQVIALKNYLEKITNNVYVVDYKQKNVIKPYKVFSPIKYQKNIIKKILILFYIIIQLPFTIKRKIIFYITRKKEFKLYSIKNIKYLDCIVCGSDQIWNPNITGGIDKHYYGIFDSFYNKKVIYGASDGGELDTEKIYKIREYFSKNDYISVREKTLYDKLINSINYKFLDIVLDPVFLLEKDFWRKKAILPKYNDYILIYKLEDNKDIINDAYFISEITNKKIIEIVYNFPIKKIFKTRHYYKIGILPYEFIGYFINASYILTNSFHGTAFSIIFEKNFFSYKLKKRQDRIIDLLNALDLKERYVETAKKVWGENIDYNKINISLNNMINKSKYFLISALINNN